MSQLAWDRAQGPPIGWSGRALARQQGKLARGTKDEEHAMSAKFNSEIAVIGIDIGKNSFHIPQTHIAWSRRSADASQICPSLLKRAEERLLGIGCCALPASGHAAAPPSCVMNSRRFTWLNCMRYLLARVTA